MKKRFVVLCAALFSIVSVNIQAQEEALKPENETALPMEEVIVTATRLEEKVAAVPANVSIIDQERIQNTTALKIPDLLRSEAGIQVSDITGNGRNYNVDLRGFGETAPLNTLVLVDGRRINQADLSGTDWTLIPLDRVKRIEVIRGGRGSVLYGDNAAGGVVNIITKEGDRFRTGAEFAGGSYDTFKGNVYLSGSANELSYALSGSYYDTDGYRDNSDSEAKDGGLSLNYDPSEWLRINFSSGLHHDKTGLPGGIKESEFAAGADRTDSLNPDDFAEVDDFYLKGGPEIYFLSDSLFKVDVSYRKRDSKSFASFDAGNFQGDTDIETVSVSPQMVVREKILGFSNTLTLGFDYTDIEEDIVNTSVFFGFLSQGDFRLKKKNYGYYIHEEFYPLESLSFSGGYRYDKADYEFSPSTPSNTDFDEDLYTAGVNYNFYGNSHVYFSYAKSFRYPVLDEIFSFFSNTIDTNLKPQKSDDYEFGVRHYFTDKTYANVNLFRIDTKNEIFFNPTTFLNENLENRTRRDGVEISMGTQVERLALKASYTYTDATIDGGQFKDNEIPNVAKHLATVDALLPVGWGFSVALNGSYVGKRRYISDFDNDFGNQDDYFLLNAKLKYNWKWMTTFLNLNNILNEEYSEFGSLSTFPVLERGFYPSPKFNFLLGVAFDY